MIRLKNEKEIERSNSILNNPNFLAKAPKEKVDLEKNKLEGYLKTKEELLSELKKVDENVIFENASRKAKFILDYYDKMYQFHHLSLL